MKLLRALFFTVAGLAVLWSVVFLGLFFLGPRDGAAPDDSAILPTLERIPDEQNAMVALLGAVDQLALRDLEPRRFLDPKNWIPSEADRLVTANTTALQAFEAALERPQSLSRARQPEFTDLESFQREAVPPNIVGVHQLAELMLVRAELKRRSNDADGAWQDMLTVAQAGRRVRQAKGTLIEYMVGASFERLALDRMRLALPESKLDAATWRERLKVIQALATDGSGLQEALKSEYRFQRLNVEAFRVDQDRARTQLASLAANNDPPVQEAVFGFGPWLQRLFPAHYVFAPNRTLERLTTRTTALLASSGVCVPPSEPIPPSLPMPWQPNAVGESLIALTAPNPGSFDPDCGRRLSLAVLETEIALRLHQLERIALPPDLDALKPAYLKALPLDPYANPPAPLKYDATQKNLRSESGLAFELGF